MIYLRALKSWQKRPA